MVCVTFPTRSIEPPQERNIHYPISIAGFLTGLNEAARIRVGTLKNWPQILRRFDMIF